MEKSYERRRQKRIAVGILVTAFLLLGLYTFPLWTREL